MSSKDGLPWEDEVQLFEQAVAEGQSSEGIAELLGVTVEDVDWARPAEQKFWRCEECGHEDRSRPLPPDREKFYARVAERGSPKCPKCKSIGFMPVGF